MHKAHLTSTALESAITARGSLSKIVIKFNVTDVISSITGSLIKIRIVGQFLMKGFEVTYNPKLRPYTGHSAGRTSASCNSQSSFILCR